MAIQPIDLQALFSQLDKVGKTQADLKEAAQLQQAAQAASDQKKIDQKTHSVSEAQDSGDGSERVKDKGARKEASGSGSERRKKEAADGEDAQEDDTEVVRDPQLGRNVDLRG